LSAGGNRLNLVLPTSYAVEQYSAFLRDRTIEYVNNIHVLYIYLTLKEEAKMSTNYYVAATRKCEDCQVEHMCYCGVHLGKSSGGNRFLFAYNGGKYYKNISELREWLKDKRIIDEYGRPVTYDELWDKVQNMQSFPLDLDSKYECLIDGYRFMDGEFS
jgi:hypothetical protein